MKRNKSLPLKPSRKHGGALGENKARRALTPSSFASRKRAVAVEEICRGIINSIAALESADQPKVRVGAMRDALKAKGFLPVDDRSRLTSSAGRFFREAKASLCAIGLLAECDGLIWRPRELAQSQVRSMPTKPDDADARAEMHAVMDLMKDEGVRACGEWRALDSQIRRLEGMLADANAQFGVERRRRVERHAAAFGRLAREKVASMQRYARTERSELLPFHAVGLAREAVDGADAAADEPVLRGELAIVALSDLKRSLEVCRDGAQALLDALLRFANDAFGNSDVLFRGRRAFYSKMPAAETLAAIKRLLLESRVARPHEPRVEPMLEASGALR